MILNSVATTSVSISWTENSSAASWEYIVVPQGNAPGTTGTITSLNPLPITGLTTNTCYDFYVRSLCTGGTSDWTTLFNFCTQPDYCGGDHFYDTGGASGSYQDGENYTKTIFPENTGDYVSVVFNSFDTESQYDYLEIFNGPNTSSPLLFTAYGTNSPGTLTSTDSSGALTFRFITDSSVTSFGWDATVICQTLSIDNPETGTNGITYYPNPIDEILNVTSKNAIKSYTIYDLNMRLIMSETKIANDFSIDFTNYSSGLYLIKLIDINNKTINVKAIKK